MRDHVFSIYIALHWVYVLFKYILAVLGFNVLFNVLLEAWVNMMRGETINKNKHGACGAT